ncbi:MAG: hypothetical protein ACLFNK_02595 [Candidatus Woesearchaeota archaeon]
MMVSGTIRDETNLLRDSERNKEGINPSKNIMKNAKELAYKVDKKNTDVRPSMKDIERDRKELKKRTKSGENNIDSNKKNPINNGIIQMRK